MEDTTTTTPRPRHRLVDARIAQHWSQQEVADRIGTTHVNVSRWERGITRPSPYFRRKISKLFDKSEEDLDLMFQPEIQVTHTKDASIPGTSADASGADGQPADGTNLAATAGSDAPAYANSFPAFEPIFDPIIPLPSSTPLIGREEELAAIKQRLFSGSNVALTALNGLPGVGKTTLAIALAHDPDVRAHFRHGILWAGLGPEPNVDRRLIRWGTLLGLSPGEISNMQDREEWALALRSAIGTRSILLVIDDAWDVNDALTFKVGGPNCAHLVTTRYTAIAVHVAGEGATRLQELTSDESMELLRLLAPQVIQSEEQKAHDLIAAVGGLPLALTLMGNYLRLQAYSGQARRIQSALQRLNDAAGRMQIEEPRGPVERHPSMPMQKTLSLQSIIAVTDQQLSDEARKALYALSVLPSKPDNFSEEAAVAVAGCSLDAIDDLVDSGLLESSSDARYMLHQTIADYARLQQQGSAPGVRLIQYAHEFVEQHRTDYEHLDIESGVITAALETANALDLKEELVRNVCEFAPFLLMRGNYSLAKQHVERAYTAAIATDDKYGIANTLLYRGLIEQKQGNYGQAETHLQEGLTLAREVNAPTRIDALLYLGQTEQKQGNYDLAETYFQEGLVLARRISDEERISAILQDLGWVTQKRGDYTQAETYLQEGLTLARKIERKERISRLLTTLGTVAARRGEYHMSEIYLQEGLTLARQIGDREQTCLILMNLGATVGEQGNHMQAEVYFQEGLIFARQIGHREWTAVLLSNLGDAASELGKYQQAGVYFQEGLLLARQIGHREWISALLINLGAAMTKQGMYSQAEVYIQESLQLARQIDRPQMIAGALYECGNVYLAQNNVEGAQNAFNEMLTVITEGDHLIALAQYGLARIAMFQGNHAEALKLGTTSLGILETIGYHGAQEVRQWLASIKD
jgi:tetratricopeptide (TPR) repeat protein/transcriptional regulator with XRE-family HTH domain